MHAALNSNASTRHAGALHDPGLRAAIAATAATAAWRGSRHANLGWWRHGNGGYGWVGPLFWPFAYYDLYDYAFWGPAYGVSFWDYGYADLYAGIFAPYGYDTLSGYLPRYAAVARGRRGRPGDGGALAQICNADGGEIAGIPAEQINASMTLTAEQRAALEQFANASVKGAQMVRATCPNEPALTAPARLGMMQQRIEAMLGAVDMLQPPLQDFYGSLNDEQKVQFGALIDRQRRSDRRRGVAAGPDCGMAQTGLLDWPQSEIERKIQPTDAQRRSLAVLQQAAAKAGDSLKTSCQPDAAITLPARVAAIKDRLTAMIQAVKSVRAALDDFYATLSDEQKAQFESIGRERVG